MVANDSMLVNNTFRLKRVFSMKSSGTSGSMILACHHMLQSKLLHDCVTMCAWCTQTDVGLIGVTPPALSVCVLGSSGLKK